MVGKNMLSNEAPVKQLWDKHKLGGSSPAACTWSCWTSFFRLRNPSDLCHVPSPPPDPRPYFAPFSTGAHMHDLHSPTRQLLSEPPRPGRVAPSTLTVSPPPCTSRHLSVLGASSLGTTLRDARTCPRGNASSGENRRVAEQRWTRDSAH